ncbi:hypothetical protein BCV70DRAFT_80000 [Testicularia cyperi]|uniref:Uncharacterized protein n=1 Tax=Testicularia cyperi TaxID=1882483 RepID=A0A317XUN2_9BASI|nr:hypothetical protein BCV70DRAFT_80000 [Testicularia cyperi]
MPSESIAGHRHLPSHLIRSPISTPSIRLESCCRSAFSTCIAPIIRIDRTVDSISCTRLHQVDRVRQQQRRLQHKLRQQSPPHRRSCLVALQTTAFQSLDYRRKHPSSSTVHIVQIRLDLRPKVALSRCQRGDDSHLHRCLHKDAHYTHRPSRGCVQVRVTSGKEGQRTRHRDKYCIRVRDYPAGASARRAHSVEPTSFRSTPNTTRFGFLDNLVALCHSDLYSLLGPNGFAH